MSYTDSDRLADLEHDAFTASGFSINCHGQSGSVEYSATTETGIVMLFGDPDYEQEAEIFSTRYGLVYRWTCSVCGDECEVGE